MTDLTKVRLIKFLGGILDGKIPVSVEPYPRSYEPRIQAAVDDKRRGEYDLAVSKYLNIFEDMKSAQSEIMRFMYKVLLCDEELELAFTVVSLAEAALKEQIGPTYFGMPWQQTVARRELVRKCTRALDGDTKALFDYIYDMAGNPSYAFRRGNGHLLEEANRVVKLFLATEIV